MYKSSFAKLSMAVYMIVLFAASIPSNLYAEVLNPTENSQLPTYTLLEPLPCLDGSNASDCAKGTQINNINFQEYIAYVFNLIIALAAVTAVFMIVWGGFQYMSTDSYSGKTEGLNKLKNAVYGLLLVLSSYLILQTIDPRLVKIPTTLVKPLDIRCPSNPNISFSSKNCSDSNLADYFYKIISQAEQYSGEYNDIASQLKQTASKGKDSQAQLKEITKKLQDIYSGDVAASQSEIDQLTIQYAKIQNDVITSRADVIVLQGDLNMRSLINTTNVDIQNGGATTPVDLIKKAQLDLQTQWNNSTEKLDSLGDSFDKQDTLDDTYFLVSGELSFKEYIEMRSPGDSVPLVKKAFDENVNQIQDIHKKDELETSYKATLDLLCPSAVMTGNYARYQSAKDICSNYKNQ